MCSRCGAFMVLGGAGPVYCPMCPSRSHDRLRNFEGWDGGRLEGLLKCDSCSPRWTCGDHFGKIDPALQAWRDRNMRKQERKVAREMSEPFLPLFKALGLTLKNNRD